MSDESEHRLVPADTAPPVPASPMAPRWPGHPGAAQGADVPESDAFQLWSLVSRHRLLIAMCIALAGGAAYVVTSRMTPVYEARASLRIDEHPSQISALGGVGLTGGNTLATELEMLRSRLLAEQVAESVGYALRVVTPEEVSRHELFQSLSVARSVPAGSRSLVRRSEGEFVLLDESGDTLVATIESGQRVEVGGVVLELAPEAWRFERVELDIVPFDDAVDELYAATDAWQRTREAALVDVSVRDADPIFARDIANTLMRRFIDGRQGARQLEARETVSFLRRQVQRVAEQLASAERSLRSFREGQRIVSLPAEATTGVARRAELQAQRNTLEAERDAFARLLRAAQSPDRPAGDPAIYRELLAFPTLARTEIAGDILPVLAAAEERRSELLSRRTPKDPEVLAVDARITQLQQQIQALVSTYLVGLTDQVSALDRLLAQSDIRLEAIPAKEIRLGALERDARGTEAIHAMLQSRLKEAEIAAAATDQSVRLVDLAVAPREPVEPRPLLNLALALVAGSVFGMAGALARERLDGSLRTRSDLLTTSGVPVIGLVPNLRPKRGMPAALRHLSGQLRLSAGSKTAEATWAGASGSVRQSRRYDAATLEIFAEAHARLVTNIAFMAQPQQRPKVILVTSALPGDGKTTVSSNLALALVRGGQRVLLLDADLRGGRLAQLLNLPAERPGMADVLAGRAETEQALSRVDAGERLELHVIASGRTRGAAPAQLLGSVAACELVSWASTTYDTVVIDTPPVASVADAALLARLVDSVILVARAGVTPRDALAFAMEQLRIVRAPVIGAVLNDVDLRRDAAYDGTYKYYRSYGYGRPVA